MRTAGVKCRHFVIVRQGLVQLTRGLHVSHAPGLDVIIPEEEL